MQVLGRVSLPRMHGCGATTSLLGATAQEASPALQAALRQIRAAYCTLVGRLLSSSPVTCRLAFGEALQHATPALHYISGPACLPCMS